MSIPRIIAAPPEILLSPGRFVVAKNCIAILRVPVPSMRYCGVWGTKSSCARTTFGFNWLTLKLASVAPTAASLTCAVRHKNIADKALATIALRLQVIDQSKRHRRTSAVQHLEDERDIERHLQLRMWDSKLGIGRRRSSDADTRFVDPELGRLQNFIERQARGKPRKRVLRPRENVAGTQSLESLREIALSAHADTRQHETSIDNAASQIREGQTAQRRVDSAMTDFRQTKGAAEFERNTRALACCLALDRRPDTANEGHGRRAIAAVKPRRPRSRAKNDELPGS